MMSTRTQKVPPSHLKQMLPRQGMAWGGRSHLTTHSIWDQQIADAFISIGVPMKNPEFQTYLIDMFDRARALAREATPETTLSTFIIVFMRSEGLAKKLVETKLDKVVAWCMFKELFEGIVKARARCFQRRRKAGLPERHDTRDCLLAKAVDGFFLDAPVGNWEVIQVWVAAGVEADGVDDEEDARLAILMDDMGIADANDANGDSTDALRAGVDMDIGE